MQEDKNPSDFIIWLLAFEKNLILKSFRIKTLILRLKTTQTEMLIYK